MHRITQEIPRRAPVFGYGPFTLYGAAFQKLHLTFALPRRAPTTPDSFLCSIPQLIWNSSRHSFDDALKSLAAFLFDSLVRKAHE